MSFADLGLSDELLRAVEESGYTEPTPIQMQAIPSVLMMRDIIGVAQTGTGKTASFVLPMIDILASGRSRARMPRSLILEPTRELAAQVAENFEHYGKYHKLNMALLIGGVSMGDQIKALEKGVDVLIATPGRLMDLFERGNILLTGCSLLVIDEADRMLDMGFIPDIENICTKLPATRQTLLFSATMPPPIKKLADKFLTNPKSIEVARPATASANIAQMLVPVAEKGKQEMLRALLKTEDVNTAIIFCNRKTMVRELNQSLKRSGYKSGEIHGDMDQSARIAELDRFKNGEINLLVASDVAARGLDVKGVSHVFNFDAPWHPDDYVHRIGRTGRAGATGKAFTFVTRSDAEAIEAIEKLIGNAVPRLDTSKMGTAQQADEGSDAAPARKGRGPRGGSKRPEKTPARENAAVLDDEPEAEAPAPRGKRPARRAEPKQAAPKPREDDVSDEDAAPRQETARSRNPRPSRDDDRPAQAKPAQRGRDQQDSEPDDGWNGPMPGFLSVGFGE